MKMSQLHCTEKMNWDRRADWRMDQPDLPTYYLKFGQLWCGSRVPFLLDSCANSANEIFGSCIVVVGAAERLCSVLRCQRNAAAIPMISLIYCVEREACSRRHRRRRRRRRCTFSWCVIFRLCFCVQIGASKGFRSKM